MSNNANPTSTSILEKFEFYFLGLTFTMLGLSIQTANFNTSFPETVWLEIIGWIGLLISGLAGLSKVEHLSPMLYVKDRVGSLSDILRKLRAASSMGQYRAVDADKGEWVNITEAIEGIDRNKQLYELERKRLSKWHTFKHHLQRYAFLIGLISIAAARAYVGIQPLI